MLQLQTIDSFQRMKNITLHGILIQQEELIESINS
jgi:hypothetical protein